MEKLFYVLGAAGFSKRWRCTYLSLFHYFRFNSPHAHMKYVHICIQNQIECAHHRIANATGRYHWFPSNTKTEKKHQQNTFWSLRRESDVFFDHICAILFTINFPFLFVSGEWSHLDFHEIWMHAVRGFGNSEVDRFGNYFVQLKKKKTQISMSKYLVQPHSQLRFCDRSKNIFGDSLSSTTFQLVSYEIRRKKSFWFISLETSSIEHWRTIK